MALLQDTLIKYPNELFIETGTNAGRGVIMAMEANCFKKIISIELSEYLYNLVVPKFINNKNVELFLGDSAKVLPEILKNVNSPATFWLDGHYSGQDTALGDVNSPLIFELEAIKNHYIKTHTILIDDMRCWTNPLGDYDKSQPESNKFDAKILTKKLLEINSNYNIHFIDSCFPNDILVAKPK